MDPIPTPRGDEPFPTTGTGTGPGPGPGHGARSHALVPFTPHQVNPTPYVAFPMHAEPPIHARVTGDRVRAGSRILGRRTGKGKGADARGRLPWGWLEWFIIGQTFLPAIVFLPGASAGPIRVLTRTAVFSMGLLVCFLVAQRPFRKSEKRLDFPARPWVFGILAWLAVMILHPETNSMLAGMAAWTFAFAVISPVFWAERIMDSPRRMERVLVILFLCQGLSSAVGLLQVRYPTVFLPPDLLTDERQEELYKTGQVYELESGDRVTRPCGLTDSPGAASFAGACTGLLGLCLAVRSGVSWPRRAVYLGFVVIGEAVIYYTMVRSVIVMQLICVIILITIFLIQKRWFQGLALATIAVGLSAGVLIYIAATPAGNMILSRYATLLEDKPTNLYQNNRGMFVQHAFDTMLWEMPLGGGLGRWGMIYNYFGDKTAITGANDYWVEVQWSAWILDGGFPLLIAYCGALAFAMWDNLRISVSKRTPRELSDLAAMVFALNLSVLALTFSYVPFSSSVGMQFWLLATMLHGANRDQKPRLPSRRRQSKIPPPT